MNIVAIVQARMGSKRLSGKVLKDIINKPVLWHIVNRLRYSVMLDKIVLAIPNTTENRILPIFAQKYGIEYYAGSETDLLDRIYQTARKFHADVIVWITADCPLIDPEIVDKVITEFVSGGFDIYTTGKPLQPRPIPDGLDTTVLSFAALAKMWHEEQDPLWREWFIANFARHSEYRYGMLPMVKDLTSYRWTLDDERDLALITRIYENLYKDNVVFHMRDIFRLLRECPELMEINKGSKPEETYRELFKCVR